jgi:hypothetical protein
VHRKVARIMASGLLLGLASCLVVSDPSALTEGCDEGTKACGGRCVSLNDPETGCSSADCVPCVFDHGVATCQGGGCYLSTCRQGYADCDGDGDDPQGNGCEMDIFHDASNCGGCGDTCDAPPHAVPGCAAGDCSIDRCAPGWGDCDGDGENGCEVDLTTSSEHCGVCGRACAEDVACIDGGCS